MRSAVLRQPALGNVQAGEYLDARKQRLRQYVRRTRDDAQHSVNSHSNGQTGAKRFDVNVGRPELDRLVEKIIDGAYDRSAAGKIAKALDIILAMCARYRFALGSSSLLLFAKTLRQRRRDILEGRNCEGKALAKNELSAPYAARVGGIGNNQSMGAVLAKLARIDGRVPQEAG